MKTPGVLSRKKPSSVALLKYGAEVAISSSLSTVKGSDVWWWMFRSPRVSVGVSGSGNTICAGTKPLLLRRPLVLYELIIENLLMEGLKKPLGVKRSRAITSPLPKKRGRREIVDKKEL